jgi:hypothetical protein
VCFFYRPAGTHHAAPSISAGRPPPRLTSRMKNHLLTPLTTHHQTNQAGHHSIGHGTWSRAHPRDTPCMKTKLVSRHVINNAM